MTAAAPAGGGGNASSPGRSPAAAAVAEQLQRHCADQRARLLRGEPSVFASPGLSVGAFLRSPHATGDEPDVQVTVHPWDKYSRVWASPLFSIATVEIANNQPNSRGRVALRTAVPTDPPLFDGPYLHDINDSRALRWAMREVRRIVRTPPLDKHIVEELVPGEHRQAEGELLDAIACGPQQTRDSGRAECDLKLPVNHLAGTAASAVDRGAGRRRPPPPRPASPPPRRRRLRDAAAAVRQHARHLHDDRRARRPVYHRRAREEEEVG